VEVAWTGGAHIRCTGNSFATPHMSGLCALVLGKHPDLTPFQLKSVLYLTSSNVGGGQ
jgi:subtilisin family serine protease